MVLATYIPLSLLGGIFGINDIISNISWWNSNHLSNRDWWSITGQGWVVAFMGFRSITSSSGIGLYPAVRISEMADLMFDI